MLALVLGFMLVAAVSCQNCENNGTYSTETDSCVCPSGFIDKRCSLPAYELKSTDTKVHLTNDFTFAYFGVEEKIIYRFSLTFCTVDKAENIKMLLFAQQEEPDGSIVMRPSNHKEMLELTLGGAQQCKQIYSSLIFSLGRKANGELPKIVFGLKLQGEGTPESAYVNIKCETSSIFSINFIVTILISFITIILLFMVAFLAVMLRRKYLLRRARQEIQMKKLTCVNKIMPPHKYEDLVEQSDTNPYDLTCSICLCEFSKGEEVRKTPCGHIYHAPCLDSWCNAHLNCPICRKNFDEGDKAELEQELGVDRTNIRDHML